MQALYKIAEAHIGLMEWPGAKHNPEIVKMLLKRGAVIHPRAMPVVSFRHTHFSSANKIYLFF